MPRTSTKTDTRDRGRFSAKRKTEAVLADVGVEIAPPTIPDCLDEVAEMVLGAALERADEVPVPVEQGRLGDEPSRAVDDIAGAELRAEGIGLQPPDLGRDSSTLAGPGSSRPCERIEDRWGFTSET